MKRQEPDDRGCRLQSLHALHQPYAKPCARGRRKGHPSDRGKAPILQGALLSTVIVPFMKMEPPYDELKELIAKILDWWTRTQNPASGSGN